MYRKFSFEGNVHQTLECVPLTVRRKLDLAELKISLRGWQALSMAERMALCHLPVDSAEEVQVYRDVLAGFAARGATPLEPLGDPGVGLRPWNVGEPPALVRDRLAQMSIALSTDTWAALDEESRYALLKMANPKRAPEKLRAVAVELGIAGPVSEKET